MTDSVCAGVAEEQKMTDNIMFYPAVVLMIVEAGALIFLIWAWNDAKRRNK